MPAQYPSGRRPMMVHGIGKLDFKCTFKSTRNIATSAVAGVTKSSDGTALDACTVNLFDALTNILLKSTVSDESGNYRFDTAPGQAFYIIAYKAGNPDVAGTTINTLQGA